MSLLSNILEIFGKYFPGRGSNDIIIQRPDGSRENLTRQTDKFGFRYLPYTGCSAAQESCPPGDSDLERLAGGDGAKGVYLGNSTIPVITFPDNDK
ncbi:hypothetical protein HYU11_01725 [Candidatus Woesearchaeota archaeon]|nr:hypothetical protein [Candidatus Woesearchaeota archaeon]